MALDETLKEAVKPRPRHELVMLAFRPAALAVISWLAPYRPNPLVIVLLHSLLGLLAAALIATQDYGAWVLAAFLLQLKTLLDNVDGGLARATDQVTVMGRYLDTVLDTLVNLALFVALAAHGPLLWSLLAYLLLVVILSLDFNAERLYHQARAAQDTTRPAPDGAPRWLIAPFKGFYDLLLSPQDEIIARYDRWLFRRVSGHALTQAPRSLHLAWNGLFSTAALVNLGLSSQLALLGFFLLIGLPYGYVLSLYLQGLYVLLVQLWRGLQLKKQFVGCHA